MKGKVKSTLIVFFDTWRTAHKGPQAKQSTAHTNVTFFDNCVKMCEDFALSYGDKRTGY
jgi:hypothetical protein